MAFISQEQIDRLVGHLLTHPKRYWATAVAVSLLAALAGLWLAGLFAEADRIDDLETEVSRRAATIMSHTLNGKHMGSLSFFGLTNSLAKDVAIRRLPADTPDMRKVLRLLAENSEAEGCFIVDKDGIISTSYDSAGKSSSGMDVRFRPYYRIAMEGRENIYAALSVNTGRRALYFAAPIHAAPDRDSPVIGAAAVRLGLEQVDALVSGAKAPALLITPLGVVFASSRPEWLFHLAGQATPERIEIVRASKQFGKLFDSDQVKTLPFALTRKTVEVDGRPFALASAPVIWNDPQGDWTLVVLSDLSNLIPPLMRAAIVLICLSSTMLAFFMVYLLLRNIQIKRQARQAEAEAAERVRKSEANLRRILEASPIPILITRLSDQTIMLANERAGEYFGLTPAELSGRSGADLYANPEDRLEVLGELDEGGRVKDAELTFARADGGRFVGLLSAELIELAGEEVVLCGLLDITDRKRAEEETRQANEKLRDAMEVIAGSIRYASRIQRAVLPDEEHYAQRLPEHFALWRPRDLVGGDIYWYREWGEGHLIILADCTGHGVPGAFMTLISGGALEVALRRVAPGDPAGLIAHMHKRVQNLLSQHVDGGSSDDGLELGVCYLPPGAGSFVYAGAHFSLFVAGPDKVELIKGDRSGIGYRGIPQDQGFTNHVVPADQGARFYMATDGLFDQIGESSGRAFGKKRFQALLAEIAGEPFARHGEIIYERLEEHQGSQARRDDLAIIGFTFGGNHAGG